MTNLKKMIFSKINNGEHENDRSTEKRALEDTEAVNLLLSNKKMRVHESDSDDNSESSLPLVVEGPVLKPYPYFNYTDYSTEKDDGCKHHALGRIPSFTKKLHEILSCEEFQGIIAWNAHGRSWRILKPKEFELSVIPAFFDHHKFSSFIRQANGWGFRRITEGPERNSYYHERFLRGLPHLCKKMKRPGVSAKKMTNPDQEPDLYAISQEHPVPELKRKNGNPPTTSGNSHWVIPATTTTTTSSSKSPVMVLDEEESKRVPAMVDISSVSTAVSSPSSTPSPTPTTMSPRRAPDLGSIDVILEELVSRHRASAAAATVPGRMSFAVSPTARNPMTFPSGLDDYSSRLALQLQFDQNARLAELVSRLNPPIPQLRAQSSTVLFAPRPQMDHTTSALAREYLRVLASQQQPSFRFI